MQNPTTKQATAPSPSPTPSPISVLVAFLQVVVELIIAELVIGAVEAKEDADIIVSFEDVGRGEM